MEDTAYKPGLCGVKVFMACLQQAFSGPAAVVFDKTSTAIFTFVCKWPTVGLQTDDNWSWNEKLRTQFLTVNRKCLQIVCRRPAEGLRTYKTSGPANGPRLQATCKISLQKMKTKDHM